MAFAFYTAMALIGLSGLAIGALVFLGVRPVEAALTGALGATIFFHTSLRWIMRGAPPPNNVRPRITASCAHTRISVSEWMPTEALVCCVEVQLDRAPSPKANLSDRHHIAPVKSPPIQAVIKASLSSAIVDCGRIQILRRQVACR
jgi:hypothetical protein